MDRRYRHAGLVQRLRRTTALALIVGAAVLVPGMARAQSLTADPLDAVAGSAVLAPTIDATSPLAGPPTAGAIPQVDTTALPAVDGTPGGSDPTAPAPGGKITLRATTNPPSTSTAKLRQGPPKLPPLEAYARSQKPKRLPLDTTATGDVPATPAPVFGPTVAALPAPTALRHARLDPEPFAPIGFAVGSLRLTPYVEQSLGFDSNPDQIDGKTRPSGFSRTEGGFDLLSLWSSNQLKATMHAGYDEFFSDPGANRPDANGIVDYRVDATRTLTFDTEGRFAVSTQRPGSPEVNVGVVDRPLVSTYGASVGANQTLGRLTLGLHGTVDRDQFENGRLSDGTVVILDDQNYNDYGIVARAEYDLLPTIRPFVQVTLDTRQHDQTRDQSGYARNSDGVTGQIGTTFEITHLLTGSIGAGYGDRHYADPRLRDLGGPVVNASLAYAITPLTTLGFTADTSFNETNVAGSSGSESRSFAIQATHALLRNLTLTGSLGYLNTDYIGSPIVENTYSGTLKASYNVTRSIVLDATYNHATLRSNQPASSYTQDVVMLGMRLQH